MDLALRLDDAALDKPRFWEVVGAMSREVAVLGLGRRVEVREQGSSVVTKAEWRAAAAAFADRNVFDFPGSK